MDRIPEIILRYKRNKEGDWYITASGNPEALAEPRLMVRTYREEEGDLGPDHKGAVFPVFAQNAMEYGVYSDYVNHHGCACCSLTTLLAAYCPAYRTLRPEDTIGIVERKHFPEEIWRANYSKPGDKQMPVTLYGISRILTAEGVENRYIGPYREKKAYDTIKNHLKAAKPVVIETSRIRKKRGVPVSIDDRKYAGSYHTMILLGFDHTGKVVFTDSATRDWAGQRQRLKRDRLESLMQYMFPQWNFQAANLYFDHRWNTGGFILIDRDLFESA